MGSEVMTGTSCSPCVLTVWGSVEVVVAHLDDETFGRGAILDALTGRAPARHRVPRERSWLWVARAWRRETATGSRSQP